VIRWYGSNAFYGYIRAADQTVQPQILTPPYANGFLGGEYVVTSITNLGAFELPVGFDLSFFIPKFAGQMLSVEEVSLVEIVRCRVRTVESVDSSEKVADFRPQLGPKAQIEHFKLPLTTNGLFRLTRLNRKWPEEADQDFRARLGIGRLEASNSQRQVSKRVFQMIMIFSILASSLIVWRVAKKTQKQTNK
jgi:hypothetical protein